MVEGIERIGEPPRGIGGILPQFVRVNLVPQAVNGFAVALSGHSHDQPAAAVAITGRPASVGLRSGANHRRQARNFGGAPRLGSALFAGGFRFHVPRLYPVSPRDVNHKPSAWAHVGCGEKAHRIGLDRG